MDLVMEIATTIVAQFQKPTLAFLIGGMLLAALGGKLQMPPQAYQLIVLVLLLKIGMSAGASIRAADPMELLAPAIGAALLGVAIVVIGGRMLAGAGVSRMDAMATAGLFGAVSASTLAAAMAVLDDEGIAYEGFVGALYPFMDIAALVTAIVLAKMGERAAEAPSPNLGGAAGGAATMLPTRSSGPGGFNGTIFREVSIESLRSPAISALLLGLALGAFAQTQTVFESFYEPLFRGLLSLLMLAMGIEAWSRLSELRRVAHVYAIYAVTAPLIHGAAGLAVGIAAHHLTGFSAGGAVLLAVMAASSSDISGPPTLRAALPEANASAYIGASTGLGTPVAILSIPLFMALADAAIGFGV
ncbi:MAG: sodium-dependent bicarbonate transport family permease [Pseudomonadota bacterium]